MPQLLLTRSAQQNAVLVNKIARPDLPTFNLPLLEAQPIVVSAQAKSAILNLDQFDEIIFISKNAVAFGYPVLEQYWPQWPISIHWMAVGAATAGLLMNEGLDVCFPALASSEGLLALDELKEVVGHRILIVRGLGGRETLKQGLTALGAKVEYLEVYQRFNQIYSASVFPVGDDVIALLYSGEAIEHLHAMIGEQALRYWLVVPSLRLRELAISLGFGKVELAKSQEDEAMIKVMTNILGRMV